MQYQEKVKILNKELLPNDNCRLTIQTTNIARTAVAGQFVMVCTGEDNDPLLPRPFSIHDADNDGVLKILFKVVGKGTKQLAAMPVGKQLSLVGPLGNGFSLNQKDHQCIVGGGMGIAPMLFLAKSLNKPSHIILGARNKEEIEPLLEEFKKLSVDLSIATDDGSYGHHGLVIDLLTEKDLNNESVIYSCGPKPMLYAINNLCSEKNTICQVSMETVMACGIGACLGCTIAGKDGEYVHICADGPVFDAKELLWTI